MSDERRPHFRRQMSVRTVNPLLIGLRAARANVWPGLCLQVTMLLVVVAYYRAGWAKPWFDQLAVYKAEGGIFFSMAASIAAGAVLPEFLRIICFQHGRATARDAENLSFGVIFWGLNGLTVDLFYRAQGNWFGMEPSVSVLLKKVAVDQFVYSTLFAVPFAVWSYEWKNRRFRTDNIGELFTPGFYVGRMLPTTIANWGVWIPATALIYSLPPLLQVPLFSLALTFWALILAYINASAPSPRDASDAFSDRL